MSDKIGKYRVIAKLGQGGMARVLLTVAAGKAGFEKLLVVKELREELAGDPEFLTMFLDEARLAARLNHSNVVQTYEVGQDGDRHFIAMDYLEGQSLVALQVAVGRSKLPIDVQVRVLSDMLSGLHYAHTLCDYDGTPLCVVHRDVSPHNVFITYDGQVRVLDFGIAKAIGASAQTRTGVYKGKPAYMAPEQVQTQPVDARADIFSAGVMLWEALAGKRFAIGNELAVLSSRVLGTENSIREVAPSAPPELVEICEKAMALSPASRFESAGAMRDALESWLDARESRVGPKELGAYLVEVFGAERASMRARIDEQLRLVRSSEEVSVIELTRVTSSSGAGTPASPRQSDVGGADEVGTVAKATVSTNHTRLPRRSLVPIILGAAATLLVVGIFALRSRSSGSAVTSATSSSVVSNDIDVDIRVHPAAAELLLDNVQLQGNPFHGSMPKDGRVHELECRLEGYVTLKRKVVFDRDFRIELELQPAIVPAASLQQPSSSISPPTSTSATAKSQADKPHAPSGAPKPTSTLEHPLDESNPYAK